MSLSKVEFNRTNNGLGGVPANEDGISAIIFYHSSATPATYIITSQKDIEDLGYTYSDGTNGFKSLVNYHVSEYFKKSVYKLYVKLVSTAPSSFSEIVDLKNYANGEIRMYGIWNGRNNFSTTHITAIQTQLNQIELEYAPAIALYDGNNSSGIANTATVDLRTLNSFRVANLIGDDYEGQAGVIRSKGAVNHVGSIGTALGWLAFIKVNQCLGEGINNVVTDNFANPAFSDGTEVRTKSKTFLDGLDTFHHTFLYKKTNDAGTYYNFDYTCTKDTDDFQQLSLNRVWDKALRLLHSAYNPLLNSQLLIDPTSGKLAPSTTATFENIGNNALYGMITNQEVSGISVTVDPNQKVLATKKVVINCSILPTGTSKVISVNLGFKASI